MTEQMSIEEFHINMQTQIFSKLNERQQEWLESHKTRLFSIKGKTDHANIYTKIQHEIIGYCHALFDMEMLNSEEFMYLITTFADYNHNSDGEFAITSPAYLEVKANYVIDFLNKCGAKYIELSDRTLAIEDLKDYALANTDKFQSEWWFEILKGDNKNE